MGSVFSFLFPILLLAMGAYVLYGAIKGEGKLFSMENIKDDSKDQAKKVMRILYFCLAAIMLVMALTNTLSTVLYNNRITYFKVTEEYTRAFPDMISENGTLYQVNINNNQGSFAKEEKTGKLVEMSDVNDESLKKLGYEPQYQITNEKMDQNICYTFMQYAYAIHSAETDKFPQQQSAGMLSCMGGSTADFSKYYNATDRLNDDGEPIYNRNGEGHVAYYSLFSKTRSDAKDDSFAVKLYHTFSETLLRVLNYVFLGLAVLGVVAVFLVTRKYTDKEKLQKAREQQVRPAMPSEAFNFDDDEPKQNAMKEDK